MKELSTTPSPRRKNYVQPQLDVYHVVTNEIICASGQDLDYDDEYENSFTEG